MIQGLFDSGALPALQRLTQFTEARHKVLTHDIANVSTPFFKPVDLDPQAFQHALGEAIDRRRASASASSPLKMRDTDQLSFGDDGVAIRPEPTNDGVLYHDQNNRDVVRLMQNLAENTLAHSTAVEMIRNQFAVLQSAIRERV